MADSIQPLMCGVDVSSETLDIACTNQATQCIANAPGAICQWLDQLPPGSQIALESTGGYHETLLQLAQKAGFVVYLVNARQLRYYREAVGPRAKTDGHDARLLRRYLCHEQGQLTPANVLNSREKRLWELLKRRAMLVKMKTQIHLSTKSDLELRSLTEGAVRELEQTIRQLEQRMLALIEELGWEKPFRHCQTVPGIGVVNALALVTCFHRGRFRSVDQFIAYLGLDVRVRDSGKLRGKRKLTKRGEPEVRRLLYNGAMSSGHHPAYRSLLERLRSRGLSATAAYVALSRKMARIAFALMRKDEDFMFQM